MKTIGDPHAVRSGLTAHTVEYPPARGHIRREVVLHGLDDYGHAVSVSLEPADYARLVALAAPHFAMQESKS